MTQTSLALAAEEHLQRALYLVAYLARQHDNSGGNLTLPVMVSAAPEGGLRISVDGHDIDFK